MHSIKQDIEKRVNFIKDQLLQSGTKGVVFGNSGGKDCALVGALSRLATENVIGVIMPCGSRRNYDEDTKDALEVAAAFNFKTLTVDLTPVKQQFLNQTKGVFGITDAASSNVNPRLRMTTLYALAQSQNYLVAGTGNKSEIHLGYFTKWGDGAYDFNPIADLTATEVLKYLAFLKAPSCVLTKAPSAALYDGQTDEADMGMSYQDIDLYLTEKTAEQSVISKIERMHKSTAHKRQLPPVFRP